MWLSLRWALSFIVTLAFIIIVIRVINNFYCFLLKHCKVGTLTDRLSITASLFAFTLLIDVALVIIIFLRFLLLLFTITRHAVIGILSLVHLGLLKTLL